MKYFVLLGLISVASAQFSFGRPFQQQRRPQQFFGGGGFGGGGGRGGVQVDGTLGGSEYHYSWLHDGGREYVHSGAVGYCSRLGGGWAPVSIESPEENNFVNGVISSNRLPWIWTGGVKAGAGWRWLNGSPFSGINWSHTGGFQRPQPDNREGNENCLAILNNFYNDGLKWHDVACHHEKATICERGR